MVDNCAKHVIAAGIDRVVYVEPYPKSKALEFHDDSAFMAAEDRPDGKEKHVLFEPFVGIGPRRFFDVFSMRLTSSYELIRKDPKTGKKREWDIQRISSGDSSAQSLFRKGISCFFVGTVYTRMLSGCSGFLLFFVSFIGYNVYTMRLDTINKDGQRENIHLPPPSPGLSRQRKGPTSHHRQPLWLFR